jgi:hypothetical protein
MNLQSAVLDSTPAGTIATVGQSAEWRIEFDNSDASEGCGGGAGCGGGCGGGGCGGGDCGGGGCGMFGPDLEIAPVPEFVAAGLQAVTAPDGSIVGFTNGSVVNTDFGAVVYGDFFGWDVNNSLQFSDFHNPVDNTLVVTQSPDNPQHVNVNPYVGY